MNYGVTFLDRDTDLPILSETLVKTLERAAGRSLCESEIPFIIRLLQSVAEQAIPRNVCYSGSVTVTEEHIDETLKSFSGNKAETRKMLLSVLVNDLQPYARRLR